MQKHKQLTEFETLDEDISELERSRATDVEGERRHAILANLEKQCAKTQAEIEAADAHYAQLSTAAEEALSGGETYDASLVERACTAAQAARAHATIVTAARATARTSLMERDRRHQDEFAAKIAPLMVAAVQLVDRRLAELDSADALIHRLHNLATHEASVSRHTLITSGWAFSKPDRSTRWRERVTRLYDHAASFVTTIQAGAKA